MSKSCCKRIKNITIYQSYIDPISLTLNAGLFRHSSVEGIAAWQAIGRACTPQHGVFFSQNTLIWNTFRLETVGVRSLPITTDPIEPSCLSSLMEPVQPGALHAGEIRSIDDHVHLDDHVHHAPHLTPVDGSAKDRFTFLGVHN